MGTYFHTRSGFTLIEMLVTLALMVLLFSLSAVGYRTFARRQTLINAGKEFLVIARQAQANAKSAIKTPPECAATTLSGYQISATGVKPNSYTVAQVYESACAASGTSKQYVDHTYTLATNVIFSGPVSLTLLGLSGGATFSAPSPLILRLCYQNCSAGSNAYDISVTSTGLISDVGIHTL